MNKVFDIGLPKTGTKSLCQAMERIGFKTVHFPTVDQYNTLEQYDFAADLPIPTRFIELDRKFPGSKFILSLRDKAEWLASFKRQLDYTYNREPVHLLRYIKANVTEMYGSEYPDDNQLSSVYDSHHVKVYHYFKNRPNDLLVFNVFEGDGWIKLFRFLDVKDTAVASACLNRPFPHVLSTYRK